MNFARAFPYQLTISFSLLAICSPTGLQAQNYATPYTITTFAGAVPQPGSNDGTGSGAQFNSPAGVAVDAAGNVYVTDTLNYTIRKITPAAAVTTFAGVAGSVGSTDGTGSAARFGLMRNIAVDSAGNLYVADTGNHTIRKISSAGVVTTLAGLAGSSGSTDGTGNAARFNSPSAVAVDSGGNVYVADTSNRTIRKITSASVVTTLAGLAGSSGSADGTGSAARFNSPYGVAVDSSGTVFVADTGNRTIRQVTSGGVVTTLAGTPGTSGSADGIGSAALFNNPHGLTVDASGNLYATDFSSHTVRKIAPGGVVTTLAGTAANFGSIDAIGNAARFYNPTGAAVDTSGNVYIADSSNNTVRLIASDGAVTTFAGLSANYSGDGSGSAAGFNQPSSVSTDGAGNVYVADSVNNTIRKITPAGLVSTLAGTAGSSGSADGAASAARFFSPRGVATDVAGNVYVADTFNSAIRKITPAGVVTTLAGSVGAVGSADGTGIAASFFNPFAVATDTGGNVYVADTANNTIRKITSGGVVTTLAGTAGTTGSTDGTGSAARFNNPQSIAVDGDGNVYVADTTNRLIRMITPSGVVTTVAGALGLSIPYDGIGTSARFISPSGVATDAAGNLYVVDNGGGSRVIRKITSGAVVTTLAGYGTAGSTDGTGSAARFSSPTGVAVDGAGNVYVADVSNNTIRKGVPAIVVPYVFTTLPADPAGMIALDGGGNLYVADGHTVRKVTSSGVATTLAGAPGTSGSADGTGSAARFNGTAGVAVDGGGNVYVADLGTIRKVTPVGVVTTLAGLSGTSGSTDGMGSAARFSGPSAIVEDGTGNLYVADGYTVRMVTSAGVVTTLAGSPTSSGSTDGTGSAARFSTLRGIAMDGAGNIYVTDTDNYTIRKVTPAGVVTTFAGTATFSGSSDGLGAAAEFKLPWGLATDSAGNLYVADSYNGAIRKITPGGLVSTFAGMPGYSGTTDGLAVNARFNSPQGIAMNAAGTNIYVWDSPRIRHGVFSDGSPIFTISPLDRSANIGSTANFTATAYGDPAATLQWQRLPSDSGTWANMTDAGNYSGVTTGSLNVSSVTAGMTGDQFRCVASNSVNSATSTSATLTVNLPPTITLQPVDRVVPTGATTTFAAAASGIPTPSLQWQRLPVGSGTWSNMLDGGYYNGTTTGTLSVIGVIIEMRGDQFRCVATNSVTSTTSSPATLTIDGVNIANDFNADNKSDIIWQNTTTGDRGFWLMNSTGFSSWVALGTLTADWRIAASADFTGEGQTDLLWENTSTGDRYIWAMNGTGFSSAISLGVVSTDWRIVAAADFNNDAKPDILWENSVTGDRGFWLMDGTTFTTWVDLGVVATDWHIVAAGDFTGDRKTDLLWENTATGERYVWVMDGTQFLFGVSLGFVSTDWHIVAVADYNGDGKTDIVWENAVTGDRGFWLMDGTTFVNWVDLGVVANDWHIAL